MHLRRDFQRQSIQPDKSRRVVLVVGPAMRDWVGFHRGPANAGCGLWWAAPAICVPATMMLPL